MWIDIETEKAAVKAAVKAERVEKPKKCLFSKSYAVHIHGAIEIVFKSKSEAQAYYEELKGRLVKE